MLTITEAIGLALCPPRIKNLNDSMFAIGIMVLQGMTICGILVQEYRITIAWSVIGMKNYLIVMRRDFIGTLLTCKLSL